MKTENSVGPQIVNDERNQLMINESTTYDQEYLIDTNYKSFDIDEIFAELDREPPLLHSQQLPEMLKAKKSLVLIKLKDQWKQPPAIRVILSIIAMN
ncbi:NAC transcription factor 29-like [Prunus yedoensis var. nudiflora]|uniref:NAC transcription factor 29-like n=1 Tax=Prunus yedoensis var. nudiflora TaxID=2094558 RepID=A0A314YFV8_PRUYE|nr:NAC transcription factor 29-like [Prunus yedoensis var. nudiflora]